MADGRIVPLRLSLVMLSFRTEQFVEHRAARAGFFERSTPGWRLVRQRGWVHKYDTRSKDLVKLYQIS